MGKKIDKEFVKQYFFDNGCELLDEYINSKTKMKYICNCGNKSEILFDNFKKGVRCYDCGRKKTTQKQKLTQEYVENYFKKQNCELLDIYTNYKTKMKYKCSCGNISEIRFCNFQKGNRCMECSGTKSYTIEKVKNIFEKQNCKLIEDKYINFAFKLKYICKCGNLDMKSLNHFLLGRRCRDCSYECVRGSKNIKWIKDRNKVRTREQLQNFSSSYKNSYRKKYNISKEFEIDHIIPIVAFRDHDIFDLNIINHESNLRPLTKRENISKRDKYLEEDFINYMKQFKNGDGEENNDSN